MVEWGKVAERSKLALLGIGNLPFSCLLVPVDYWASLFPSYSAVLYISAVFNFANVAFLAVLVFFLTTKTPSYYFRQRIVGGFAVQAITLFIMPLILSFAGLSTTSNFVALLIMTIVVAMANASVSAAAIAVAVQYDDFSQSCFQLGVGVSSLIGCIYRDVTKIAFSSSDVTFSAVFFFMLGTITLLLCIVAYESLKVEQSIKRRESLSLPGTDEIHNIDSQEHHSEVELSTSHQSRQNLVEIEQSLPPTAQDSEISKSVLKMTLWAEMAVFIHYITSRLLWPPIISIIPAYENSELNSLSWWALILLTIYAFCDCIGRLFGSNQLLNSSNILATVSIRAILSILVILLCASGYIFRSDYWSVTFVCLLGFTNGFMGTRSIISVNETVTNAKEKTIAGGYTSFFLNAGVVIGSFIAIAVEAIWFPSYIS